MVLAALSLSPQAFFAGDSGSKYLQAEAFASGKGWPRAIPYPARELDPSLRYIPVSMVSVDGRLTSFFPYLFPLLAGAGLHLVGQRALLLVPAVAALVAAWWLGVLTKRLGGGRSGAILAASIALAATPLMFYGACLWEHSLLAAVAVGAAERVVKAMERPAAGWSSWATAGFLAGVAGWVRTEGFVLLAIVVVPLLIQSLHHRVRATLSVSVGAALGVATGALVQEVVLGRWLPIHLVACIVNRNVYSGGFLADRLRTIRNIFTPDPWVGVALVVWVVALVVALRRKSFLRMASQTWGVLAVVAGLAAAVGAPLVRFMLGVSPSLAFPVRTTATWVALSALPLVLAAVTPADQDGGGKRRFVAWLSAWYVASFLLISPVDGGYQWGARIFLPVALWLTALMASRLPGLVSAARPLRLAIASAIAAGVLVQLLGLALLVHVTRGNHSLVEAFAKSTRPGEVVVTDTFYLPELAAPLWLRRRILFVGHEAELPRVLERLRKRGVTHWALATCDDSNAGLLPAVRRIPDAPWREAGSTAFRAGSRVLTVVSFGAGQARRLESSSPGADSARRLETRGQPSSAGAGRVPGVATAAHR